MGPCALTQDRGREAGGNRKWGTTETGGASSGTGDKRSQDSGGKKHKSKAGEGTRGIFLNVTSEDLWNLQKMLHSKEGSLGKTCKTNIGADAEVFDLNQKTMKVLETPKAGKNLGEVDQLFDKDFVMMQEAMIRTKEAQRFMRGLGCIRCRRDELSGTFSFC